MEIYTIGFTQKSASQFFESLKRSGIKRLIDVRLNNVSQLAGFAKKTDLEYFLKKLCDAEYLHLPILAPTQALLDQYKKEKGAWSTYEEQFLILMKEREIEKKLEKKIFDGPSVLLCSEPKAEHCHRRLVLEYLKRIWPEIRPIDL